MFKNNSILTIIFFILLSNSIYAQVEKEQTMTYFSDELYTTKEFGPEVKILIGNVIFKHDNSEMFCDSALFNTVKNQFNAFGNIQIIKPGEEDTVFVYGDTLHYLGHQKLAKIRNNVKLIKDSLTLITDSLDYDLNNNIGYYFANGTTINDEDTLKSVFGYYYSDLNEFFFKDSVVIQNPRFTMYSDTLKHNTKTKTSYFLGPTDIISEENYIYCENGWYNHKTDKAQFSENSFLKNKEKTLKGDKLYYDRNSGIGKAYNNVTISDTVKNAILMSEYCMYNEKTGYSFLTDSALFIQITDEDSLFLHADTLCAYNDTINKGQEQEHIYRIILAYNKAKIFKSDFQAKCDSLVYTFKDSVIEMHYEPVMWSDSNQLNADYIQIFTYNNEVEQVVLTGNAFMISQSDSVRFDQTRGDEIVAWVENKELYKIDVNTNCKSIYFAKDDYNKLIAVNVIECEKMAIYFKEKKPDRIWFYNNPKAKLYPPLQLSNSKDSKIEGFKWFEKYRPLDKSEIFMWNKEEL